MYSPFTLKKSPMSINREQRKRFTILHELLSKSPNGVSWEAVNIAYQNNGISVSRKTVFNDIKRLEEDENAPIDNVKGKYFYTEPFSLYGQYNPKDVTLAHDLGNLLHQFAKFPHFKGLEEVQLKLKERFANTPTTPLVQFEQNDEYVGLKRLNELYEAIKNQTTLKIKYQDFGKVHREYTFSPYLLKEYSNRWHVYGYEQKKDKIYNLALDRILSINTSEFRYIKPKENDLIFLNDIIGFTYLYEHRSGTYAALETIKIKVEAQRANFIHTKPLHHSHREIKEESTESYKVYEYRLRINNELIAKLLEFGKDLEVIEPLHLRERMIEHIKGMAAQYKM